VASGLVPEPPPPVEVFRGVSAEGFQIETLRLRDNA
jgi:hypothetical protein